MKPTGSAISTSNLIVDADMPSNRLCERCASLPLSQEALHERMERLQGSKRGVFDPFTELVICELGQLPGDLFDSACQFCQFLLEAFNLWGAHPADKHYLVQQPAHRVCDMDIMELEKPAQPKHNIGLMLTAGSIDQKDWQCAGWILPCLDMARERLCMGGRVLDRSKASFREITKWLTWCDENHTVTGKERCNLGRSISVPDFWVIDCASREIVIAPECCKYAALSYVWGALVEESSTKSHRTKLELPTNSPVVIEDAIVVANALGIPYLWVDRYCIDQNNGDKKLAIIQKMDDIYRGAYITIIDAAGDDSDYGLPGISLRRTQAQPHVEVRNQTFIALMDPRLDISRSTWATRGWTYQEAILSRKRLVFTRSQVHFQCREMYCNETVMMPLQWHHKQNLQVHEYDKFWANEFDGNHGRVMYAFPTMSSTQMHNLLHRLNEYLLRKLSYDSDAINAFIGILNSFKGGTPPIVHFYGLPFEVWKTPNTSSISAFAKALLWEPQTEHLDSTLTTRGQFPSWAWAHWKGVKSFDIPTPNGRPLDNSGVVSITLETTASEIMTFEDYPTAIDHGQSYLDFLPVLNITGKINTVSFAAKEPPRFPYAFQPMMEVLVIRNGIILEESYATLLLDSMNSQSMMDRIFSEEWEILILRMDLLFSDGLVIIPTGRDTYTRLGTIVIGQLWRREVKEWLQGEQERTIRLI